MRDSLHFLPIILICIAMILLVIPKKKTYTITTSRDTVIVRTVVRTVVKNPSNQKAIKTLFNRDTKEILDMEGNVIAVADTFYVDENNKITKIIETVK